MPLSPRPNLLSEERVIKVAVWLQSKVDYDDRWRASLNLLCADTRGQTPQPGHVKAHALEKIVSRGELFSYLRQGWHAVIVLGHAADDVESSAAHGPVCIGQYDLPTVNRIDLDRAEFTEYFERYSA